MRRFTQLKTLLAVGLLLGGFLLYESLAGELDPPGVPAPTARSLDDVHALAKAIDDGLFATDPSGGGGGGGAGLPLAGPDGGAAGITSGRRIFLNLPGIEGGSDDESHLNWIELNSIQQDMGRLSFSDPGESDDFRPRLRLIVVKGHDRATPLLAVATGARQIFDNATIDITDVNGSVIRITLTNVLLSSHSPGGASEPLTLRHDNVEWELRFANEQGTSDLIEFGWDLRGDAEI